MGTDDQVATEFFDDMRWVDPVDTAADLPTTDVREGNVCYVMLEAAVYRYTQGEWVQEAKKAP